MKPSSVLRRGTRRTLVATEELLRRLEREILFREANACLSEEEHTLLKHNLVFKNRHRGKRAFILGNGPSLRNQDLGVLSGELTFVVNAFYKHPIISKWQPTYYLMTDDNLFLPLDSVDEMFAEITSKANSSTFILPVRYHERVHGHFEDPVFIGLNGFLHRHGSGFPFDFTRVIPSASTVVQTAVLWAIWVGASPIYLMGCDHNWLDDFGEDLHFYAGPTTDYLPDVSQNPYRTDYYKLTEYITEMWRGYSYIGEFAKKSGVQIFNATHGGRLDVFERVKFEELFP